MIKKPFFILASITLLLASCKSVVVSTNILDKKYKSAYTETIPPGYRQDCGISFDLKYECGFKFFITTKTIQHPEEYILYVNYRHCNFNEQVSKDTYNSYNIGDSLDVEFYDFQLEDC